MTGCRLHASWAMFQDFLGYFFDLADFRRPLYADASTFLTRKSKIDNAFVLVFDEVHEYLRAAYTMGMKDHPLAASFHHGRSNISW